MDTVLVIIFILICLLLAAAGIFSIVMFRKCVKRQKEPMVFDYSAGSFAAYAEEMNAGTAWFHAQKPETVTITSFDGLKLYAYYLPHGNARGTMLLMHGYHSSGMHDFSCIMRRYYKLGFSLLIPDQRAMNRSEGGYLTFGVRERFDCRDWTRFINERLGGVDKPIVLDGISMGCTTVLMSLGLELPENVVCAIADCGFTSPREIFKHVLRRSYRLPPFPILDICAVMAKCIAGFGVSEYSTLSALRENKLPVLFVHGDADTFVPARMSVENYNACTSEKELFIAEGAGHGMSFLIKREECEERLLRFLDKYAPPAAE